MKAVPLAVAGAFHTEIMRPADQRCAEALADVPMHKPRIPVISNVDALPHDDPEEIRQILVRQILQPVRWEDSMRYLIAAGIRPVLRGRPRPRASRAVAADRPQRVVPVRGGVRDGDQGLEIRDWRSGIERRATSAERLRSQNCCN